MGTGRADLICGDSRGSGGGTASSPLSALRGRTAPVLSLHVARPAHTGTGPGLTGLTGLTRGSKPSCAWSKEFHPRSTTSLFCAFLFCLWSFHSMAN